MGTAESADACAAGIEGISQMLEDVDVTRVLVEGDDAVTWFELHAKGGAVLPVASWSHVSGGKVDRIRVTFDPRPMLA